MNANREMGRDDLHVYDLDADSDLMFVSDSQDVAAIREHIGPDAEDYDSFFVATADGDYTRVYGMEGIVPLGSKRVYAILPKRQAVSRG